MPYKGVGRVKNATKDAMINFTVEDGTANLLLYTSGCFDNLRLTVSRNGALLYETTLNADPCEYFEDSFATDLTSA